jgi:serine protease Do
MNRIAIWVGLLILLINLVRAFPDVSFERSPPQDPRSTPPGRAAEPPLPVPPPGVFGGRPVPGPRPDDPLAVVEERARETADTVGTAFAIDGAGRWLTARHVIEGCRGVSLHIGGRWRPAVVMDVHATADAALVGTPGVAAPPLPFGPATLLFEQDGFHSGYPGFSPGDVHSKLLGRVRVMHNRRSGSVEYAYVWAELSRVPDREASLGGISGGPLFDAGGRLIGINIAESSRRGRITTSSPETMRQLAGPKDIAAPVAEFRAANFPEQGRAVRAAGSVVRVFCARTGAGLPAVRRGEI